jgi:translation initiation factor eIF-2B subunit delta
MCSGRKLLSSLVAKGIPCSYGLLTSLSSLISQATLVLLGTASLLANGALYARAGTAPCAMMAKSRGVPVIVCCETYKFSERVQLDGFVINEAGNPTDILAKKGAEEGETPSRLITASEWKENNALGAVNLLYDLTPPRYVTAVASEVGLSGPESVGVILRDYKSVLYGQ